MEPDAEVAVFVVVLSEERFAERSGVLDRSEGAGDSVETFVSTCVGEFDDEEQVGNQRIESILGNRSETRS